MCAAATACSTSAAAGLVVGGEDLAVVVRTDGRRGAASPDLSTTDEERDVDVFAEHLVEPLGQGRTLGAVRGVALDRLVDGDGDGNEIVRHAESPLRRRFLNANGNPDRLP